MRATGTRCPGLATTAQDDNQISDGFMALEVNGAVILTVRFTSLELGGLEQVPNQVPTIPVSARRHPTPSDAAPCMTCGYRTTPDTLRRIRGAWHAEGPGFESP